MLIPNSWRTSIKRANPYVAATSHFPEVLKVPLLNPVFSILYFRLGASSLLVSETMVLREKHAEKYT